MKYPEGAKEVSTAGVGTLGPLAVTVLGGLPENQRWIGLVVAGAVAIAYISWRSYLKLRGLNGKAQA